MLTKQAFEKFFQTKSTGGTPNPSLPFGLLSRSFNKAQNFNILAKRIRKKFEITKFSKIPKNLWGYPQIPKQPKVPKSDPFWG